MDYYKMLASAVEELEQGIALEWGDYADTNVFIKLKNHINRLKSYSLLVNELKNDIDIQSLQQQSTLGILDKLKDIGHQIQMQNNKDVIKNVDEDEINGEYSIETPQEKEHKKLDYDTMFIALNSEVGRLVDKLHIRIKDYMPMYQMKMVAKLERIKSDIEESNRNLKFRTTIANLGDALENVTIQIIGLVAALLVSFIAVAVISCLSYFLLNDFLFRKAAVIATSAKASKIVDLSQLYIAKQSVTQIGLIVLLSIIFYYCLRLLKTRLNLKSVYVHKIALLQSFNELSKDSNKEYRDQLTRKLIESVFAFDYGILEGKKDSTSLKDFIDIAAKAKDA